MLSPAEVLLVDITGRSVKDEYNEYNYSSAILGRGPVIDGHPECADEPSTK